MTQPEESPGVESIFLDWVLAKQRDANALESLARAHPDYREDLQRLWREWSDARQALDKSHDRPASEWLKNLMTAAQSSERYTVRDELGSGGMGRVMRVWDASLSRESAMKTLREREYGAAADESQLSRFLQEAQVTGQLEHPGIVPVHDLGLDANGQPFFTMTLVRGRDFSEVIEDSYSGRGDWNRGRAVGALLRVCEAMSYAHDQGVVHRDLKPSNIRVGSYGEVFVMDWGLARVEGRESMSDLTPAALPNSDAPTERDRPPTPEVRSRRRDAKESGSDSPLVTQDGTVIGTPQYMAPEQARGDVESVGPRSDVYATGAMLYHLLCGHSPYNEEGPMTPLGVLARVLAGAPPPIERLAPGAPAELVAVCNRAMARKQQDRYRSMDELGTDLRAYLEGRVVSAHRTGAWAESWTWVMRNRLLASALLLASLAMVGIAVSQSVGRRREYRARQAAALERKSSDEFAIALSELVTRNTGLEGVPDAVELLEQRALAIASDTDRPALDRARIQHEIGLALLQLREPLRATPLMAAAFETRLEVLGWGHSDTLDSARRRANLLVSSGQHREGEALARRGLDECRAALGPAHAESIHFEEALSLALLEQGRLLESKALLERVVEHRRAALPEDSELRLNTEANLVHVYRITGELARAEPLARHVLDRCETQLGERSPTTQEAREALGRVLAQARKFDEAEELLRRALESRRLVVGEAHPRTLDLQQELVTLLAETGRSVEAERLARETFDRRFAKGGILEPYCVSTAMCLAGAIESSGRPRDAEGLLVSLYEEGCAEAGRATPELLVLLSEITRLQFARGDLGAAEPAARELVALRREFLGASHHLTFDSMDNLARVLASTGQMVEAEQLRRDALAGRRETLGSHNRWTVTAIAELGANLLRAERTSEALPLLEEAAARNAETLGNDHPTTMRALATVRACQSKMAPAR